MWLFMKCKETKREIERQREGQGAINKEAEGENGKRTKKKSLDIIFLLGAMVDIKVTKENETDTERERDRERERERKKERDNAKESQKERNKKKE